MYILQPNNFVFRNGLKKSKGRAFHFVLNSMFIISAILMANCSNKGNGELGVPLEDMADVVNQFETASELTPEWKLESSDHKLTVYTTQDSIENYSSMALILYHDGSETKAVSEESWRKKYNLKDSEPCPLFSNGHCHLYTVESKLMPESPIYVIVTEDLLDEKYTSEDSELKGNRVCVYAHAYRIKDGQLQPENAFNIDGKMSFISERDTTLWIEWVHDVPSLWPSQYDKKARTLEIASVDPETSSSSIVFTKKKWQYDDKLGFLFREISSIVDYKFDQMYYTTAMSEKFPKHKVQISSDGCCEYQYAAWQAKRSWASKPSIIIEGGEQNEKDGSFHFRSKDGFEYVVFQNPSPEGPAPSITAIEVRKGGKIIYREETEY